MINTHDFKTKTIIMPRHNESVGDIWSIALDIGYSAVKGFSNNMIYCFPSYARKLTGSQIAGGKESENDIQYKDNVTGEIWRVGEAAISMITSDETGDSNESLYGRNRYYDDMFLVIARVGLGLGMMTNDFGSPSNKNLVVQTGLPPKYRKSDSAMLKDVLARDHNFSIKRGSDSWISFSFSLPEANIAVMDQPMGTLMSIATNNDGSQTPEAMNYFSSNILIMDPGFGTLDVFNIKNRTIASTETYDNLGMKRVLQETVDAIYEQYHQEILVPAMQKCLSSGEFLLQDKKRRVSKMITFSDILEKTNHDVCMEALNKINTLYNGLFDYNYLVVTGGTGAAWEPYIKEYFKDLSHLTIIPGNQNDDLPFIFSNVRGYYMYLISKLKRANN
jgi:plasmid segregation protein ParM